MELRARENVLHGGEATTRSKAPSVTCSMTDLRKLAFNKLCFWPPWRMSISFILMRKVVPEQLLSKLPPSPLFRRAPANRYKTRNSLRPLTWLLPRWRGVSYVACCTDSGTRVPVLPAAGWDKSPAAGAGLQARHSPMGWFPKHLPHLCAKLQSLRLQFPEL